MVKDLPTLIIISGVSGTGKTTLGKKIAKKFKLPFIYRDEIKEIIFDQLGYSTREWSHSVGLAAYDLLYYFAKQLLIARKSFILESTFKPEISTKTFLDLKKQYPLNPLQIRCQTKGEVLLERFKKRSESGERHPGHVDHNNYEDYKETLLRGSYEFMDLGGKRVDLDTTNYTQVDYQEVLKKVKNSLNLT